MLTLSWQLPARPAEQTGPEQVRELSAEPARAKGAFSGIDCDVHVRRNDNLANMVNRSGRNKKVFCIHSGNYDLGSRSLRAKSGLRLIGAPVKIDFLGSIDAPTKIVSTAKEGVIAFLKEARNVQVKRLDISGATGSKKKSDPRTKKYGRGINGNGFAFDLTVRKSRIHHNTNAAIGGIRPGALVARVELDHNGSQSYLGCCAGGMKSANDYTIKKSYVHDNTGFGVWQDVCGGGFVVRKNRIARNSQGGVRYEHNDNCGGNAEILHNIIKHNNASKKSSDGGGVIINSAPNANVGHNILGGNHGVGIEVRGNRGPVKGTDIHDNRMNGDDIKGCDKGGVDCSSNVALGAKHRWLSMGVSRNRVRSGKNVDFIGELAGQTVCSAMQVVKIKQAKPDTGKFRNTIAKTTTDEDGVYRVSAPVKKTKDFRAVAPGSSTCNKAKSDPPSRVRVRA